MMKRKTMKKKDVRINILIQAILWLLSVTIMYPILMIVSTSLKSKKEANYLSAVFPTELHLENYLTVWQEGKVGSSIINSVLITVTSAVVILVFAATMSFIVVRRDSRFCKCIDKLMTFGIIAPIAILPTVQLFRILGIYGTRLSLILLYSAIYLPFSSMLFSSFIKGIPRELDEAAVMDGAKGFRLFFRVVFPLLKPVTATTGILCFMWVWNDFQYPLYFLNSSSKWTLPLSVYNFYGQYSRNWNLVCADMVIVSLPILIVYAFAQRYIIDGMTAGAVKG